MPKLSQNITLESELQEDPAVKKWKEADKIARKFSGLLVKNVLPFAVRSFEDIDLSTPCSRSLIKFLTGVKQLKLWAFKMLDSSGKIPNGLFMGSINSLGDYDECMETVVPGYFRGQYCILDVSPPLPERRPFSSSDSMIREFINITDPESATAEFLTFGNYYYHLKFRSSICVPSTCNVEDIQKVVEKAVEQIGIAFAVTVPNCETKTETFLLSNSEIAILIILGLSLLLGVVSTIIDIWLKLSAKEEFYQAKN
ncbi:hypothetical protein CEXT_241691 [Caerostris extrusa]|uniref:Nose resistant-to-fluoxetine protein N-terminal domain-containing protein n=1 Tax=Caerostris extrusa TaxID=172846 RepID=A0AAV4TCW7_CAEEX|nr:hypothetical protein CEXT_241691 [Caerostris extrusa]